MDSFQFLCLSPTHIEEHQARLNAILRLKENILGTIKTVQQYAEAGSQLVICMQRLAESFRAYNEFQSDPTIRSISDLLLSFGTILGDHYTQVEDHVVQPLRSFMKNDIQKAEDAGKAAIHDIEIYLKALDACAAMNKKKVKPTDFDKQGREVELMKRHQTAVSSDFMYERALSLVERKKLVDVTAVFLVFVNLASVAFKQCHFEAESSKEFFQQLQLSIPESTKSINEYAAQSEPLLSSVIATTDIYWKRLYFTFPGTNSLVHEGYLWKKGSGITKSWRRRYFICKNNELSYFHNAQDSDRPQGKLPLLLTTVKPLADPERRHCFTIISQQKVYTLQALTEWDMNEWMNVIKNNIQFLLDNTGTEVQRSITSETEGIDPSTLEYNEKCADCGMECPKWCCINWGTCICIMCSGTHREMTTSVSKVRSLTLDRMESRLLSLMTVIGNERANEVLEERLPPNLKLTPACDKEQRREFLSRKYEHCEFVDATNLIDMRMAIEEGDLMSVFKGICQMKKLARNDSDLLKQAAAFGRTEICLLLGLNTERLNDLDCGGWSALSYAAYYGQRETAQALLSLGCDPNASKDGHPYAIATVMGHQDVATMFIPYWSASERPAGEFTPPLHFHVPQTGTPEANAQTLQLIGKVERAQ